MKKSPADTIHVWLVFMKAFHAMARYAATGIGHTGLGNSDFRVLEVLQHKGPLPVNTIGPKVNLNPGSISVAVDRLYSKGLVSRVESAADRRVRIVPLTAASPKLLDPPFQNNPPAMPTIFTELAGEELRELESSLKKVGKRAEALSSTENLTPRPQGELNRSSHRGRAATKQPEISQQGHKGHEDKTVSTKLRP